MFSSSYSSPDNGHHCPYISSRDVPRHLCSRSCSWCLTWQVMNLAIITPPSCQVCFYAVNLKLWRIKLEVIDSISRITIRGLAVFSLSGGTMTKKRWKVCPKLQNWGEFMLFSVTKPKCRKRILPLYFTSGFTQCTCPSLTGAGFQSKIGWPLHLTPPQASKETQSRLHNKNQKAQAWNNRTQRFRGLIQLWYPPLIALGLRQ